MERQFRGTFARAERQSGITGENLLVLLERRLDNVVYRLGFAESRAQARQLVGHGHITVNGRRTKIASYLVREGDIIGWRPESMSSQYYKQLAQTIEGKTVARWLSLDRQKLRGEVLSLPTLDDVEAKFDIQAVVGYYSR